MKRIVSFTLAISMIISVVGILPVAAKPYETYPFVYEDFEINNLEQQKAEDVISSHASTTFQWTADGAAGSRGAIDVMEKGNNAHMRFSIDGESMIVGQNIRYSCWIKPMNTEYVNKTVSFIVYGYDEAGTLGWTKEPASVEEVNFTKGEWGYVETMAPWDGMLYNNASGGAESVAFDPTQPMYVEIRIGSGDITQEFTTEEDEKQPDYINYRMDDVIIEPFNDPNVESGLKSTNILNGSNMNNQKDIASWMPPEGTVVELSDDKSPDGTKYMIIRTPDATTPAWVEVRNSATLDANHLYRVSFDAKSNIHATAAFWFLGFCADAATKKIFPNYPGLLTSNGALTNEWRNIEFYIYADHKAVESRAYQWGIRFFYPGTDQHAQVTNHSVSVDNFRIDDMGYIINGSMEETLPANRVFYKDAETNDAYFTKSAVPFWFENGATTAKSTEVRGEDTYGEKETISKGSMQVTVDSDGGYVYQPLDLENDKSYKISFWAKGNDLESELPLTVRFDRKVEEKEALDVYDVPDEEILDEEGYMLTNEWRQYEFIYTTSFTAKSPKSNAIPRQPYMNISVGDNVSGTSYFIDDFVLEEYDPNADPNDKIYKYPYSENVAFSGEELTGTDVVVDYDFLSDLGRLEGRSMLRLLKKTDDGNWITVSTKETDGLQGKITLPEEVAGEDVKIELALIDEIGLFGKVYSYEIPNVGKDFDIEPSFVGWDSENGKITTETAILCNTKKLTKKDVTLILAQYDANGIMVKVDTTSVRASVGFDDTIPLSSTADSEAVSAKLFVWSGTSLGVAGESILAHAIGISK